MDKIVVHYPIQSLDKSLVIHAGTEFSAGTLNSFYSDGPARSIKSVSMLDYGSTRKDLLDFAGQHPYEQIFSKRSVITEVLNVMEGVSLMLPFLESLDFFKKCDFYTYRHTLMVFALSTILARDLVPDYKDWRFQQAATGPTHDFGKTCVPLEILQKSTPLTRTEYNMLAHHTTAGYVLISYYHRNTTNIAARVARDHHERRNRSGYPRGIALDDFLVEIIAVSDIYDALISPRPYRPISYDNRSALEELTSMAERKEISLKIVKALIALNRKDRPHYSETKVSAEKRGAPPPGNVHGIIVEGDPGTK